MGYGPTNSRKTETHGNPNDPFGGRNAFTARKPTSVGQHLLSYSPLKIQLIITFFMPLNLCMMISVYFFLVFTTYDAIIYHQQLLPVVKAVFPSKRAVSFSRPWKLSTDAHSKRRKSDPGGITSARHSLQSAWIPRDLSDEKPLKIEGLWNMLRSCVGV